MIFSITLKTDAKENNGSREKYYTSVLIEEGDSLWSIAEKYKPDESISVKKYIKDLKRMNNMESDIIHSGNYLTIYYYQD
jgi:cell division protein YceG involved in septum cleavage